VRSAIAYSARIVREMSLVVTASVGLCLWIVIWALGVSGLDAMGLGLLGIAVMVAVRTLWILSSRKDQ